MTNEKPGWIEADWPLSARLRAGCTTRSGGVSKPPFDSMNLGLHVEDNPQDVRRNRTLLGQSLSLPEEPLWLRQTHGTSVCRGDPGAESHDAAWTQDAKKVLVVLTADCLPVVIASPTGEEFGVAHAGWRGLADGVLAELVGHFTSDTSSLHAWLGPAIGPRVFEVGDEVRQQFMDQWNTIDPTALEAAFSAGQPGKWFADIYQLARLTLAEQGLIQVHGGEFCTLTDEKRFYSYRRDGRQSGRMATLIWRA